jgi:hypothetical protein
MKGKTNLRITVSTFITIVGAILSLSSFAFLAKSISSSEFIDITSFLSAFVVLWEVYDFGRTTYLLRNYKSNNFNALEYESHILRRKFFLFLLLTAIILPLDFLLRNFDLTFLIFLEITAFLQSASLTSNTYFRSTNNLIINSFNNLIEKIVLFALILNFHSNILELSIIFSISALSNFLSTQLTRKIYGNQILIQFRLNNAVKKKSVRMGSANALRIIAQLDLVFLNWFFGANIYLVTYTLMSRYANSAQTVYSQFLSSFQNLSLNHSRTWVWQEHKFFIKIGAVATGLFSLIFVFSKTLQNVLLPHEKHPIYIIFLLIVLILLELLSSMRTAQLIAENLDFGFLVSQMIFLFGFASLIWVFAESINPPPIAVARIIALLANLLVIQFFLNTKWLSKNDS